MNTQVRRKALGGLCAMVLGLTGLGAGATTALAQTAQPAQTSQTQQTDAGSYALTGADGTALAPQQGGSDAALDAATTPQQGAPDLKNVKQLPDTVSLSDMFAYGLASAQSGQTGDDALAPNAAAATAQAPAAAAKASMTLFPQTVSHADLAARRAIAIHAEGFAAGEALKYEVAGPGDPLYNMTQYFAGYADNDGRWINTISYLNADYARKGDYTVKLTGMKSGATVEDRYTITDEPAALPAGTATMTLASDSITQADMRAGGMKFTAAGFKAGESVKIYAVTSLGDAQLIDDGTADANGELADAVVGRTSVGLTGLFQMVAVGAESGSAKADFTVVANDDPFADAVDRKAADGVKLTIAPQRISQYALGLQGVKFTVDGMQKDEQVEFIMIDPFTGFTQAFPMMPTTYPKPIEGQYSSPLYDTSLAAKPGTYEIKVVGTKSGYVTGNYEVYDDTSVTIDPKIEPTGTFATHVKDGVATMTQSELLKDGAISFKATGFVPGDYTESTIINPNGSQMPGVSGLTDKNGVYTDDGTYWAAPYNFGGRSGYNNALVPGSYTLVVADHYAKSRIYTQITINVTDDSAIASRGKVAVSAPTISAYDLYKKGLALNVSGFGASELGSLLITTPNGSPAIASPMTLNGNGSYQGTFTAKDPETAQTGEYKVVFYTNDADHAKQEATFTVTDERAPEPTIDVTLSAATLTQSAFHADGLNLSATGLTAYQYADVRITEPDQTTVIAATVEADADGNLKLAAPLKRATDAAQTGTWNVEVKTKDYHHGEATFTVTGDKAAPGVDKSALQALVDKVGQLHESDYTADSWAKLAAPLAAANETLANASATQAQVNTAWGNLSDAVNGLVVNGGSGDNNGGSDNNGGTGDNNGSDDNNAGSDADGSANGQNGAGSGSGSAADDGASKPGSGTANDAAADRAASGSANGSKLAVTGASMGLMAAGAMLTIAGAVMLLAARKERA